MKNILKNKPNKHGFSNIIFLIFLTSIFLLTATALNQINQKTRYGFENEAAKAIEQKNNLNDSLLVASDENGSLVSSSNLIAFISNQGSKDATNIKAYVAKANDNNLTEIIIQRTTLPPDQNTTISPGEINAGDKIILTSKQGIYINEVIE
ncbi:MAG: hypothetical protein KAS30_04770 [Candidatus Diapherotrites archaeon]|nr:hypothetical protein [Candidatus Diapherotrites archaeon]